MTKKISLRHSYLERTAQDSSIIHNRLGPSFSSPCSFTNNIYRNETPSQLCTVRYVETQFAVPMFHSCCNHAHLDVFLDSHTGRLLVGIQGWYTSSDTAGRQQDHQIVIDLDRNIINRCYTYILT